MWGAASLLQACLVCFLVAHHLCAAFMHGPATRRSSQRSRGHVLAVQQGQSSSFAASDAAAAANADVDVGAQVEAERIMKQLEKEGSRANIIPDDVPKYQVNNEREHLI